MDIIKNLIEELKNNNGKISQDFTTKVLNHEKTIVTHQQLTPNTRVCVITLASGHDLVGFSQVLDSKNDIAEIGMKIAEERASNEIWGVLGSIAKAVS